MFPWGVQWVSTFRTHLDNLGKSPHLKILNLITPVKILCPYKIICTVSKDILSMFGGGQYAVDQTLGTHELPSTLIIIFSIMKCTGPLGTINVPVHWDLRDPKKFSYFPKVLFYTQEGVREQIRFLSVTAAGTTTLCSMCTAIWSRPCLSEFVQIWR